MQSPTVILFNKNKLVKFFILFVVLALLGVWFITMPHLFIRSPNPYIIKLVGYTFAVFFGLCGVFAGKKLFDRKPGLIIDEEGILDHSGGINIGKILWKDILGIREQVVSGQKLIMIDVKNPEEYLDREKNPLRKRILDVNNRMYRTPINIAANDLKIRFEELSELIDESFAKFKN